MNTLNAFIDRAKVILTAAVTYLTLATTVITGVLAQVVPVLPDNIGAQVAGYGATALAFIAGVVSIIRRVTPVDPIDRGILPPPTQD